VTRDEFTTRFPNASEITIRLNCSDAISRGDSSPTPRNETPVKPKERRPERKPSKRVLLPRTRNAGTMTEGAYWGALRSLLRGFSLRRWKPRSLALAAAKVPFNGPNNQRFAYRCCVCLGAFKREAVDVDHVESCGKLGAHEEIGPFVARLLAEDSKAWRVMCKPCHQARTNAERNAASPSVLSNAPDLI
jgi:hypothetical protein